jgi:hypothetical protein
MQWFECYLFAGLFRDFLSPWIEKYRFSLQRRTSYRHKGKSFHGFQLLPEKHVRRRSRAVKPTRIYVDTSMNTYSEQFGFDEKVITCYPQTM